jgi:hypothetical protein
MPFIVSPSILIVVTSQLKARMLEQEDMANARQQHSKHLFRAVNEHTTIEKLFNVVFSVLSLIRLLNESDNNKNLKMGYRKGLTEGLNNIRCN